MTNTVEYLPNRYTANGVTTTFSFDFKIIEDTDVEVFIEASGVQTKLTNGTDYTVSFTVGSSGGSIITDEVYDDCDIIIARKRPVKQTTSFTTADGFQADVIETNIADDLNIQIQQVAYDTLRSIKLPVGSDTDINLPYPIEGKSIIGTSDGGYTNSTISVDEIQTYVDEANAAADLAQAAVGSIPTPVALNYLRQKSDISGFEYRTPEQVAGDIQEHINIKMIPEIGTSSTASATAEKVVVCSGFELVTDATIQITFSNANTNATPTLNINSTGAKSLKTLQGDALTYIPANIPLDFRYDGTNLIGLYTNTFAVMPDYAKEVSKSWNTLYTAETDGWVYVYGNVVAGTTLSLQIDGIYYVFFNATTVTPQNNATSGLIPVCKNSTYRGIGGVATQVLKFYPTKGAN